MLRLREQYLNIVAVSGWVVAVITLLSYHLPGIQHADYAPMDRYCTAPKSRLYGHQCSPRKLKDLYGTVIDLETKLAMGEKEPQQNFSTPCSNSHSHACTSNCCAPLSDCPTDRLYDLIMSPQFRLSPAQRQTVLSIADSVPEADIIFLTAASSNHYEEMQAMYHNLHTVIFPHITNYQAVLVDLGLSEEERQITEKYCKCKVIPFPAATLPEHCNNTFCYSWKPLIVRAVIEKAGRNLVYMDTSIRYRNFTSFTHVLDRAASRGVQYWRFDGSTRVPLHTLKQTFNYFGWEPCAFDGFPELEGSTAVYGKNSLIVKTVLEPWARCALEPTCICPVNPENVLSCSGSIQNHMCHRFDQSVLTMLTARVFSTDITKFICHQTDYSGGEGNFLDINREDRMPTYFSTPSSLQ